MARKWQLWSVIRTVYFVVSELVGLGGVPSDIETLAGWTSTMNDWWVRILLIVSGGLVITYPQWRGVASGFLWSSVEENHKPKDTSTNVEASPISGAQSAIFSTVEGNHKPKDMSTNVEASPISEAQSAIFSTGQLVTLLETKTLLEIEKILRQFSDITISGNVHQVMSMTSNVQVSIYDKSCLFWFAFDEHDRPILEHLKRDDPITVRGVLQSVHSSSISFEGCHLVHNVS